MILVLLGPPGSGKGTQAKKVCKVLGIPQISTGDILREVARIGTKWGLKARFYADKGELVPDDVMLDIVRERLLNADCKDGFVLDGFPRTINQAQGLERILNDLGSKIEFVLNISVAEDILVERLECRRQCEVCRQDYTVKDPISTDVCDLCGGKVTSRTDDIKEAVVTRLKVYHEKTEPLNVFYRDRGNLLDIDGEGTIEQVHDRILKSLSVR